MKHTHFLAFFCFLSFAAVAFAQNNATNMFDNANLADWAFHVDKEGVQAGDVFAFTDDGVLACKGQPFGWLGTKKNLKNFKLAVEYRWPEGVKPTNSGIFLRAHHQKKDSFLPRVIEVQLAHGQAGDLWGFNGMGLPAPATCDVSRISWRDNGTQVGISCGVKHLFNNENEPGQWNSMEIVCSEGLVVVQLNGKIVNWVLNAEQTPGKLAFQSEGGPIEFRNAMLTELP